jgi:hypothetical protein
MKGVTLVATLFVAAVAHAAPESSITVGVFLPTTLADGQQRYDYGEKLAAALGTALGGAKPTARNFARYADFQDAWKTGKLDVAVVDAWIAAEASDSPIALASIGGTTKRRWAIVGKQSKTFSQILGKPLALTRGAGTADIGFVSNVVFDGALVADKALGPTFAPSIESAIKMWQLGNADAVLVPAPLAPADGKILYQSSPLPIAVVLVQKSKEAALRKILTSLPAIAPFDAFTTGGAEDIASLRRLIVSGPAARPPVWADTPPLSIDLKGLVTWKGFAPTLPSLTELSTPGKEQPDD